MVLNGLRCRNSLRESDALREDIFNVGELGINTNNCSIHLIEVDPHNGLDAAMVTLTEDDLSKGGGYQGLVQELEEVMACNEKIGHYLYHVIYPCDPHFYQVYYHNDATYTKGKFITGNVLFYHHVHDVKLHIIVTRQGKTITESRAFDEMEMEFLHRHATKIVNHVSTTLEKSNKQLLMTSASSNSFGLQITASTGKLSPTSTANSSRFFSPPSPTNSTGRMTVLSADPSTFTGTDGSTITIDPNLTTPSYRKSPNTAIGYVFPSSPVRLNPKTNMLYTVDVSKLHK